MKSLILLRRLSISFIVIWDNTHFAIVPDLSQELVHESLLDLACLVSIPLHLILNDVFWYLREVWHQLIGIVYFLHIPIATFPFDGIITTDAKLIELSLYFIFDLGLYNRCSISCFLATFAALHLVLHGFDSLLIDIGLKRLLEVQLMVNYSQVEAVSVFILYQAFLNLDTVT